MKTTLFKIYLVLLSVIMLTGCSYHNGGDTRLWGTWLLEEYSVDSETDSKYEGNCFWKFQTQVILIQEYYEEFHDWRDHFGTYDVSHEDKLLTLDFTHHDDNNPQGSEMYTPPAYLGIEAVIAPLEIITLTSKQMILSYESPSGHKYIYRFKRWM